MSTNTVHKGSYSFAVTCDFCGWTVEYENATELTGSGWVRGAVRDFGAPVRPARDFCTLDHFLMDMGFTMPPTDDDEGASPAGPREIDGEERLSATTFSDEWSEMSERSKP